jgi:ATP-dependent DNA helicase RecG
VCLLIADPATEEAEQRLAAMVATNDGFELAHADLQIRGQGTVFGARLSGMADLRVADIFRDADLLLAARHDAFAIVAGDPRLEAHPDLADEVMAMLGDSAEWLLKS